MNRLCRATIVLLTLGCLASPAAEPTFYSNFQAFLATNDQAWEVRSPMLVDTNNSGFKLTNALVNLASIRTTAALAGVRPGMTMDEVVACWGKPMELWAKGFGGPRFRYKEVSVLFEPGRDWVKTVYTHDLPSLMRRLEITPKIQECISALGDPTYREDSSAGSPGIRVPQAPQTKLEQSQAKSAPIMWTFLVYEKSQIRLKVGCERGKLATLQLESSE